MILSPLYLRRRCTKDDGLLSPVLPSFDPETASYSLTIFFYCLGEQWDRFLSSAFILKTRLWMNLNVHIVNVFICLNKNRSMRYISKGHCPELVLLQWWLTLHHFPCFSNLQDLISIQYKMETHSRRNWITTVKNNCCLFDLIFVQKKNVKRKRNL